MFCTNHSRESRSERWFNKLFGQQITGQGKFLLAVFLLGFWELPGAVQRSLNKPSVWCGEMVAAWVQGCAKSWFVEVLYICIVNKGSIPSSSVAALLNTSSEVPEICRSRWSLTRLFPKSWLCTVKRGGERRLWDFAAVQHHHYHLLLSPPRWGCPTSKFCCWSSAAAKWPGGAVTSWLASGQVENSVAVVLII